MVLFRSCFHVGNQVVLVLRYPLNFGFKRRQFLQTKCIGTYQTTPRSILSMCQHLQNSYSEKMGTSLLSRLFHSSPRHFVPPWLVILYKFKGLKVLKWLSVLVGRTARKFHNSLPPSIQQQISRHKVAFSSLFLVVLIILYFSYQHYDICPHTKRKRWISFTRKQILFLAETDHQKLLEMYKDKFVDKNLALYQVCNSLVKALIERNSDIDEVKSINWNLNVVKDNDIDNAFVLPNGEIYLFTGMIQLMNDWEELAIVLSHEMAHSILGHAQEQQSFLVFGELLFIPFLAFFWYWFEDFTAYIAWTIQDFLFPMFFEVVFNLPYSRQLEMEADLIGLEMATKACFDPRWGVLLWDKMAFKEAVDDLLKGETTEIKFLSSHPSHDERATVLEDKVPSMLMLRTECGCSKLPSGKNPLSDAHKFRNFTINVRKRIAINEEIKHLQSIDKKTDSQSNSLSKLQKQLLELTLQYRAMLQKVNIQADFDEKLPKNSPPQSHSLQFKSVLNVWSNLVGRQLTAELTRSFVPKSSSHSSDTKILNAKQTRNYYDSSYF